MNNQFDELAKEMAQSVTRRGALKKFGLGLAGIALVALGLPNKAEAKHRCNCRKPYGGCNPDDWQCIGYCDTQCGP